MAMVAVMMVAVLLSLLAYGLAVSVRVRADGTVPASGKVIAHGVGEL